MLDDILFGIARDNECSCIVCELLEYPEWYSLLCRKSLAYIYPDKAQKYAIEFWWRDKYEDDYGAEYQKIMVLHVLNIIHSTELEKYLDLADQTEYYYLKENSKEIRKMTCGNTPIGHTLFGEKVGEIYVR